jgi:hypothetical protein
MPKKKRFLDFDKDIFFRWEKEYWWKPMDDAIYKFFEQPNEKNILRSKISLLTYCYQTNIEMKAPIIKISDNLLDSPEFKNVTKQLSINPLNDAKFGENTEIYSIHQSIMKAIKRTTKTNEPVFVSKFLHFWKPKLFPILDSKAEKNLINHKWVIENMKELEPQYDNFFPNLKESQYDDRYCWYCFLLLQFMNYIQERHAIKKDLITLKALDVYLYYLCEQV